MQNDVRAVLHYVPRFRGRVFVVVIDADRMPEAALAEALLDLLALQQLGVDLVLYSLGEGRTSLAEWLVDRELRWSKVQGEKEKVAAVLKRGQIAVVEGGKAEALGAEAAALAKMVAAEKLIVFLPESLSPQAAPVHGISRDEAAKEGGLLARAAEICAEGIPRVHLLDERRQGILIEELFSNEGIGVMVHDDRYRHIRPLQEEDVPELLAMIGRSVRRSHLVPRDYEDIQARLGDFLVMTVDENVVGCVALHRYEGSPAAEVACLYVKQSHEGLGYGVLLVRAAEEMARELEVPVVFALTNRASGYFRDRLGYSEMSVEEIPEERQQKLRESGRDSVVLGLRLG